MSHPSVSSAVQDYLKAIYRLEESNGRASPADIAEVLRVKAPSVTGMMKRLAEAGWVHYESGTGATLTAAGRQEALRVIRRHRLIELFLTQVLKLDWSEVDAEAEALEHAISPRLEQAIAAHLGEPSHDPHGHPIPSADGELARRPLTRLCDFRRRPGGHPQGARRHPRAVAAVAEFGADAGDGRLRPPVRGTGRPVRT